MSLLDTIRKYWHNLTHTTCPGCGREIRLSEAYDEAGMFSLCIVCKLDADEAREQRKQEQEKEALKAKVSAIKEVWDEC